MTNSAAHSLTLTKLQRPRAGRGLVPRPHLLQQLDPCQGLTLILAPAGYGKTTLLSMWLETCLIPAAWLSLDERDDDLSVFVTYLVEALHTLFPGVADTTLMAVSGAVLPPPDMVARDLLNDLLIIQQDFVLVLDDYHCIRNPAIHDLLTAIAQHPPHSLHLVISSRHDPPLPLAALRARGYMTELRAADLRFSLEESAQFLVEAMNLELDERTISQVASRTEGWPASLRLAALSLRQQLATGKIVTDTADTGRYFMDYLVAEVLSQLPISVQEFLIKTSILDQLCSPLCEVVTGMVDRMFSGQYILEWLERADLFLVSADDQQRWYRCHQLLRQLLRERLEQLHGRTEITALHMRASRWFAENGYLDEALEHALAAQDTAVALQIVTQHRHDLMNRAQWQRLERWLHSFPREVIDEQPHLLLIEVWIKFIQQQIRDVAPLLRRVEALLPGLPAEEAEPLQGEVESRHSALLYWSGDVARSKLLAQQALEKVPLQWWYIRGYARLFLAAGYLTSGDLTQAHATLLATGEPDQGQGYRNLLMGATCLIYWNVADLSGMARAARQVIANSTPSDRAELTTFSRFHLGLYNYERNDLIAAEKYLLPLVMQPYGLHANCFVNSAVLLARIRQIQNRPKDASEIAGLMMSFALETRSEVVLRDAQAFSAELALRQGRLAEASQWAGQQGPFKRVPLPHAFIRPLVLAGILLAHGTPTSREKARQLLVEMNDYFASIHYVPVQIRVLALQARLYSLEGNEQAASKALEQSIALAEPGGFIRSFVDLGEGLKPLLQRLGQRGVSPAYLAEILAAFESEEASSTVQMRKIATPIPLTSSSALLTNREQQVLDLLVQRYSDKEIADALAISLGTVRTHIEHLGDKLDANGRRGIVQAAKEQGLLV